MLFEYIFIIFVESILGFLFWLDFSIGLFVSAVILVIVLIKRFLSNENTYKESKINNH